MTHVDPSPAELAQARQWTGSGDAQERARGLLVLALAADKPRTRAELIELAVLQRSGDAQAQWYLQQVSMVTGGRAAGGRSWWPPLVPRDTPDRDTPHALTKVMAAIVAGQPSRVALLLDQWSGQNHAATPVWIRTSMAWYRAHPESWDTRSPALRLWEQPQGNDRPDERSRAVLALQPTPDLAAVCRLYAAFNAERTTRDLTTYRALAADFQTSDQPPLVQALGAFLAAQTILVTQHNPAAVVAMLDHARVLVGPDPIGADFDTVGLRRGVRAALIRQVEWLTECEVAATPELQALKVDYDGPVATVPMLCLPFLNVNRPTGVVVTERPAASVACILVGDSAWWDLTGFDHAAWLVSLSTLELAPVQEAFVVAEVLLHQAGFKRWDLRREEMDLIDQLGAAVVACRHAVKTLQMQEANSQLTALQAEHARRFGDSQLARAVQELRP